MRLTATHFGAPQGARRHRMTVRGGHARAYTDARQMSEEASLAEVLRASVPVGWSADGPYCVHVVAWFARPGRLKRKADRGSGMVPHIAKPDVDNIAKLVLDAATRAGVWRDDALVYRLEVERWYLPLSSEGTEVGLPRVEVEVLHGVG